MPFPRPKAAFWNDSLHSTAYTSLTEGRGETVKARMFAGMLFLVTFTGGGILFDSCIDQAVAQTDKAVAVSLCELLANPLKYAGWTVSVRARVETSYHFVDLFDDENCTGALLLKWPKNPSDLQRDAAYAKFEKALNNRKLDDPTELKVRLVATFRGGFESVLEKKPNGQ